jgi:hypothetical protein
MAWPITHVPTGSHVLLALLRAGKVLHHGFLVEILGVATTTSPRASVTTGKRCFAGIGTLKECGLDILAAADDNIVFASRNLLGYLYVAGDACDV